MNLIKKFIDTSMNEGLPVAVNSASSYIKFKLGSQRQIYNRREQLKDEMLKLFNATVAYGPFKGLKFSLDAWWGRERASMILGLYEQEVLESLTNIPKKYKTFIDLGAADGYYGIGVLVNNLFENSICFESTERGQNVIRENAKLNGVADKILIYGIAEKDFYKVILDEQLRNSVLFVDIEGGEFDLLDQDTFKVFKDSIIFIELHDWYFEDANNKLQKLRQDAIEFFDITELTTASRDLSKFPELKDFSDTDRWLICSEGRHRLMAWYRLDPKNSKPNAAAT